MFKSRKFYYILFVLGALYVLIIQQFFQHESRFLFQSPIYENETVYNFDKDFQELNLTINQDLSLNGIWFKKENSKAIILLFPDVDLDLKLFNINKSIYYSNGYDVLVPAYRGTAKSQGVLKTETDLYEDAQHWYNFAKSQYSASDILLVGQGFGGSIAAQLAGNNDEKILILENPQYSYGDFQSKKRFWWLPYSFFTSFSLNTWEGVRKTSSQIILIQDKTRKGQKNNLTDFLKAKDKAYWLEKNNEHPFSEQIEYSPLFDTILNPITSQLNQNNSNFEN